MVDLSAVDLAFRVRAATLSVATTGSTTLASTATTYTRASGSFITDGFTVGSEVTPSGFPQTDTGVITAVAALTLTISGGRDVASGASGRTLTVGLPALRAYDNRDFTPVAGRPFVETELVPATMTLRTGPAQGGTVVQTGLFVVRWYGLANTGALGIRKAVDALGALFTPMTALTAGANTVRVREDVGPFASSISQRPGGWAVSTLTIPWRAFSANTIA